MIGINILEAMGLSGLTESFGKLAGIE